MRNKILFILITLFIAFIYSDMIIEPFFSASYFGSSPPLFPHPFWAYGDALLASFISILLLKFFKIDYTALELLIVLNLYLLIVGLVYFYYVYSFSLYYFGAVFYKYVEKSTLLLTVNYLTLGLVFMKK